MKINKKWADLALAIQSYKISSDNKRENIDDLGLVIMFIYNKSDDPFKRKLHKLSFIN